MIAIEEMVNLYSNAFPFIIVVNYQKEHNKKISLQYKEILLKDILNEGQCLSQLIVRELERKWMRKPSSVKKEMHVQNSSGSHNGDLLVTLIEDFLLAWMRPSATCR